MKDFEGTEIEVGDSIVYAALAGRCAVLHHGLVLGFKEMESNYMRKQKWTKIKVSIEGYNKKPKIVYLEFPDRVIVSKKKE